MAYRSKTPYKLTRAPMFKDGGESTTASGNITLTEQSSTFQNIDPNSADRTVTLPNEPLNNGLWFVIKNSGAAGEDITVQNDTPTTVRVLNAGECGLFFCDGTNWVEYPMSGLATIASLDDNGYLYGGLDNDWNIHHDNDKGLQINIADNDQTSLLIQVGTDGILNVDTRTGAYVITLGNATDDPAFQQYAGTWAVDGTGAMSIESTNGAITIGGDADAQAVNIGTGAAARAITIGNAVSASLAMDGGVGAVTLQGDTTIDIDAGTALGIESAGGAITIGGDAVAQALNLGTGAAARAISIGNAASASLAMDGGVGAVTLQGDTTIDIDAGTALGIESAGGAITVGGDAVAQAVNIGTGAAARAITIGNAASASLAMDGGVGAVTLQGDTTIDIDAGTALGIESAGGAISVGADAVAQAVNIGTGAAARVITIGNAASASIAMDAGVGTFDLDADGAMSLNSSGGALNIGNDADAQAVNIATGAAARAITIGNAASASLDIEGGVGAITMQCDTTMDLDAGTALGIESAGGAITVGGDAVAQAVNIATGAAARVISIGNAASASLAMDGGVGAVTLQGDTTIDIDAGTALGIESAGGAITVGGDAVAQAVNIGTGAAARAITIGNAASASLDMDSGVGGFTLQGDTTGAITTGTTMELDAGTALTVESAGGAISIGADAVAQPVNIATGAAARVISIGNAASNGCAIEAGVGAFSATADTTATITAGTTGSLVDAGGTYRFSDQVQRVLVTIPAGNGAGNFGDLNSTPVTILAGQGADTFIEVVSAHFFLDFVSAAYDNAATVQLRYTNGAGAAILGTAVPNADLAGAGADAHVISHPADNVVPVANALICAHASADPYAAAGDSPVLVELFYRVRDLTPA